MKMQVTKNPIKNPRITEKASFNAEQNVYTFDISASANKTEIKKAIFSLYKVKPLKVNVLRVTKKTVMKNRSKEGVRGGGRKALVYLKKGDKIEIF
jgi:large subunit ribosomal protein L23